MFSVTRALPRASLLARSARTYATAVPPPPPVPAGTPSYDPALDPQLAGLNYPQLPTESRQARKSSGWWDQQERVNFGEPVPENDDIQSMWAPDIHAIKPLSAFLQLVTAFTLIGVFAGGVYMVGFAAPALPRAYPFDGLVKELSGTEDATYAARPSSANEIEE